MLQMGRPSMVVLRISVAFVKGRARSGWRDLCLGSHGVTLKEAAEDALANSSRTPEFTWFPREILRVHKYFFK